MTDTASILARRDGDVAIVTLNRPDRLNAVTADMLDLLRETLVDAVAQGARAILVTGEGRAFCAGADLAASGGAERDLATSLRQHYNPLIQAYADLPVPVVSAVNGAAAGAGASIALAADIVVAAKSAYFLLAFANIGLVPDAGATWLVGKAAGRAKLLEMALLGEKLSAAEALETGLIARLADDADVMSTALALAHRLAAMPTVALGLIRKQVATALTGTLAHTLEIEAEHQGLAGRTEDFREGVTAFLQKRAPQFRGK